MTYFEFAIRLFVAFGLGSALGLERQWRQRMAGLRTNTLLRPISNRINQQPLKGSEVELRYHCTLVCTEANEAKVRAMLLQSLGVSHLRLCVLRSQDIEEQPGRVEVEAELATQTRDDALLEQIISRLSLDPAVSTASWRVVEQKFG